MSDDSYKRTIVVNMSIREFYVGLAMRGLLAKYGTADNIGVMAMAQAENVLAELPKDVKGNP